jgi:hypothetical protein
MPEAGCLLVREAWEAHPESGAPPFAGTAASSPGGLSQRAQWELCLGREQPQCALEAGRDAGDQHPA